MNWINQISDLLIQADKIAKDNGVDNLFYNEMFMELIMASKLNHSWVSHTQGGDAVEPDSKAPTEYKLINVRSKSPGSYQFHWLSNDKMNELSKTQNMYFGKRDGVEILEVYKVPTPVILPLIAEKATGTDSIDGHKSFSHKKILELGGELVYQKEAQKK